MNLKELLTKELRRFSVAREFFNRRDLFTLGTINAKFMTGGKESFDYDQDDGTETFTVYEFSKKGEKVYVMFNGMYTSYNGLEFDYWDFVVPKEVTRIEYVKE